MTNDERDSFERHMAALLVEYNISTAVVVAFYRTPENDISVAALNFANAAKRDTHAMGMSRIVHSRAVNVVGSLAGSSGEVASNTITVVGSAKGADGGMPF